MQSFSSFYTFITHFLIHIAVYPTVAGKIVDAAIGSSVNAGINGVRGVIRTGLRATAKSLARQGAKSLVRKAAIGATKIAATAAAKTAVGEAGDKAKAIAEKGVNIAANKTSKFAAKKYTEIATKNMNKQALKLTGKAKTEYLRKQRAQIAARADKIEKGVAKYGAMIGKMATDSAVDSVAGTVNAKADNLISKIGAKPTESTEKPKEKAAPKKALKKKDTPKQKKTAEEKLAKRKETFRKHVNSTADKLGSAIGDEIKAFGEKQIDASLGDEAAAKRSPARSATKKTGKSSNGKSNGIVTVSNDTDLKSKIARGLLRVGSLYKKLGVCYKLKLGNKSVKTPCSSRKFYF